MTTEQDQYPFPATVEEAIYCAAKHLPYGYTIKIEISKDGYNVILECPDGSEVNSVDGGYGMISDINASIQMSRLFVD